MQRLRQAYAFYMEWKGLSPLQRVQLCPRLPDELMASGYIRTEQRGVTLLLKAVSEEQQKELVVDRDLTSTAILCSACMCGINQEDQEKRQSSWGN